MTNKENKYITLLKQLSLLIQGEDDQISVLANITALIKSEMNFFWVGFYLVKDKKNSDEKELVLAPFQGSVACYRIGYGKGVCGTSWKMGKTIIVDDVEQFPGHIACSSLSKSEIVIPIYNSKNEIVGVLDIDDDKLSTFDQIDKKYLEEAMQLLSKSIYK